MSCGSKVWVPLIGVTGYISYAPALVTRQLGGMQYTPRTLGLTDFFGLFKHEPYLKEMELIRQDWKRPILVKKEEGSMFESSVSQNYAVWRNGKLSRVIESSKPEHPESAIEQPKRKRIDHEEELRRQLKRCSTNLGKSKRQTQILEQQLEEENTMRNCLNQQLEEKEEQLTSCKQWQRRAEIAEALAKQIQDELKGLRIENDKLVHKHSLTEKELAKIKKSAHDKINIDKEILLEEERSMRKAAEADMRDYQQRAEYSKEQIIILQSKLEMQEVGLRSDYGVIEEELHELKQEYQECQDYINSFAVQMNSKNAELDIEREELQRAKATLSLLETMVRTLERSNEVLGANNEVSITNNTFLHDQIRHMAKQVEQVARYA
ncbi:PREDICTED: protein CFAP45, mitochondrial-like [Populus euphratica]|uniref:Protein CFAP45, mitochondrial-like n=1 Tax=Populus euphratica TaxID=75702 RepID=A0AAJ6XDH0_POPEU|nr:PREDICTED: protein CFAP45, mitochondrial-like [Populus euphratica]